MTETQLKLRRLYVEGFKSLDKFDVQFPADMTVLIGANGAGKTSLLQCLSFIPYFVKGQPERFFEDQQWPCWEVISRFEDKCSVLFIALALEGRGQEMYYWCFGWDINKKSSVFESAYHWNGETLGDPYYFTRICMGANCEDNTETRVEIMKNATLSTLAQKCPTSFASFQADAQKKP